MMLTLRYGAFALIATIVNLGLQYSCLALIDGTHALAIAIALGTLAGLMTKYMLDKRWIFDDKAAGILAHGRKFSLYGATGLFTTAIFWGFEMTFSVLFQNDLMTLAGAALGLAFGYALKFRLDRRFVFRPVHAR